MSRNGLYSVVKGKLGNLRRLLTGKALERERQFRREIGNLRCSRSVGRRRH